MALECPVCGYENVNYRCTVIFFQVDDKITGTRPTGDMKMFCRECNRYYEPGNQVPMPKLKVDAEVDKIL